jgi:hypothetical protein
METRTSIGKVDGLNGWHSWQAQLADRITVPTNVLLISKQSEEPTWIRTLPVASAIGFGDFE